MNSDSQGILLTGASGYIGYKFTKYLVSRGFNVHLIVKSDSNIRDLDSFTKFIHIYDGEYESIEIIFNNYNVNYVVHLATHTDKLDSLSSLTKLNDVCLKLTNQLFSVIKKQKHQIAFINVGSIWQMHKKFNNAYSLYKYFQEELAKFYSINYDTKVLSLLLTDTYGPNDWRPKFLNQLKAAIINGSEFQINNPNAKIGLVFIDDICDALYLSMDLVMNQKSNFSKYKIEANENMELLTIIDTLEMILSQPIRVKFVQGQPTLEAEIDNTIALLPGWAPQIDLSNGLIRFFEKKE